MICGWDFRRIWLSRATNLLDLEYIDYDKLDEIWEYDSAELACQVRIL